MNTATPFWWQKSGLEIKIIKIMISNMADVDIHALHTDALIDYKTSYHIYAICPWKPPRTSMRSDKY